MLTSLEEYAADHNGGFPNGEATAEASLSLLYPEYADAELLRGKTVPTEVVERILSSGGRLGPETCGWHYVEGLRLDDDPRLAIFWDKAGLDHSGGRLSDGGHIVMFLNRRREHIVESEWSAFLREQEKLLADKANGRELRLDAALDLDGQQVNVQLRTVDGRLDGSAWRDWQFQSGNLLAESQVPMQGSLRWPIVPEEEFLKARVVVEEDEGQVRFILAGQEIMCDRSGFRLREGE